jgi:cytosine/adenosine deaminase-related metal-dependent hydrolase
VRGSLSIIADELRSLGLRAVLCHEISDRNGAEVVRSAFRETSEFAADGTDENIHVMLGLHAPFTLSDATLRSASEVCRRLQIGVHTHLAEDKIENSRNPVESGTTPTQRLARDGLLGPQTILAHGIYLSERDYRTIASTGAALAYNPDSNMNNGVGLPELARVPKEIPSLCGTDGMYASPGRTLKNLFLIYRHQGNSFDGAFAWIRKIYFDQIAFVRRHFPDFSLLAEGERGDFVLWDYIPTTLLDSHNFFGHYVHGILESRAHTVVQGGNILLRNFEHTADFARERAEVARQAARLQERFAEVERGS